MVGHEGGAADGRKGRRDNRYDCSRSFRRSIRRKGEIAIKIIGEGRGGGTHAIGEGREKEEEKEKEFRGEMGTNFHSLLFVSFLFPLLKKRGGMC